MKYKSEQRREYRTNQRRTSCGNTGFCNAFYRRIIGFIEHGFCAYRKPATGSFSAYDDIQKKPRGKPWDFFCIFGNAVRS